MKNLPFPGVFIAVGEPGEAIETMNKVTQEWTLRAARGECSWVCADCGCTFREGMPDECAHGHQSCTDIIARDKAEARAAIAKATGNAQ